MSTTSRVLRWPEVRQRTGLSRTTIWRKVNNRTFPAPVKLTESAVGWREAEIAAWEASLIRASQAPGEAA